MLYQLKQYLIFCARSTNQHGVHSPFVFDLVTNCFYDKRDYVSYKELAAYRAKLLKDKSTIEVKDFGAGSKVFKSNIREISQIAKTAGISKSPAKLLYRLCTYFKPNSILELGTSLGLATAALAYGNPDAKVISLEGCPQTAAAAKKQLRDFGLENIAVKIGAFEDVLSSHTTEKFDLIYFDGNHQKQATLQYFELLLPTASNNSVWIFDDIHWSADMGEAWETIKKHPKVRVTIDTFQWGIVFFRTEQQKEDFIIRM